MMSLYLACKEEERKQLEFMGRMMDSYVKAQHLMEAQRVIIKCIEGESAECAARIRRALGSLHSSGLLFQLDGWA